MNLRKMIENAEIALANKNLTLAQVLISRAEKYLHQMDPTGDLETPVLCCFIIDNKTGIIHCGTDKEPLFPGTEKERIKICKNCRDWCRKKIKEIKAKLEAAESKKQADE